MKIIHRRAELIFKLPLSAFARKAIVFVRCFFFYSNILERINGVGAALEDTSREKREHICVYVLWDWMILFIRAFDRVFYISQRARKEKNVFSSMLMGKHKSRKHGI